MEARYVRPQKRGKRRKTGKAQQMTLSKYKVIFYWTAIAIGIIAVLLWFLFANRAAQNAVNPGLLQTDIVVRGRIEPAERVITLQGPTAGGVVKSLLVQQGQQVEAGEIIALMDGYETHRINVIVAEKKLIHSRMVKAQVTSPAKKSDLSAQFNIILAKNADLVRSKRDLDRQQSLFSSGMISQQALDRAATEYTLAEMALEQAKNTLNSLGEIRDVDKEVAIAQVSVDEAMLDKAKAELERMVIRAPIAGTVLKIFTRPGESIGGDGILRMASMGKLIVIAEVDEHLVQALHGKTTAMIEGPLVKQPIPAVVSNFSREIFKQARPNSDVLIGRDARILEVELTPLKDLPVILGGEVFVRFIVDHGKADVY